VPGFVVQFGHHAYPPVSAAWQNANIKDEPVTGSNKRGYLTYAKTSLPNTRSTQISSPEGQRRLGPQGFSPFGVVDRREMKVVEHATTSMTPPARSGQIASRQALYLI